MMLRKNNYFFLLEGKKNFLQIKMKKEEFLKGKVGEKLGERKREISFKFSKVWKSRFEIQNQLFFCH